MKFKICFLVFHRIADARSSLITRASSHRRGMRHHDAKLHNTRYDAKRSTRSSKCFNLRKSSLRDISRACEDAVKRASRLKRRKQKHIAAKAPIIQKPRVSPEETFVEMEEEDYDDEDALKILRSDPFHRDLGGIHHLTKEYVTVVDNAELEFKFNISEKLMENIRKHNWSVQFGCILCNDTIQNRLHWPYESICEVNDEAVPIIDRLPVKPMGKNSRDKPITITHHIHAGNNIVYFECENETNRRFLFYVRICKKMTTEQLIERILANQSSFDMFANFHDEGIIVDKYARVSLKCPISLLPIMIPVRSNSCKCQSVFDLHSFLNMAEHDCKWMCPFCSRETSVKQIVIDRRISRILNETDNRGTIDIEVGTDRWKIVEDC